MRYEYKVLHLFYCTIVIALSSFSFLYKNTSLISKLTTMKFIYTLSLTLVLSVAVHAQEHRCTLLSPVCCSEDNEYFEVVPVSEDEALKSNSTEIYLNQVPFVHYDGEISRYPLEVRIVTDQEVVSAKMDYYDYETFSYLDSELLDDGIDLDKVAGDAVFTSVTPIVQSRKIRNDDNIISYNLIAGTVTLTYANGNTEDFNAKLDGYTIDGDSIILDTVNLNVKNEGSYFYTENAVNYVSPQEYSLNTINYPLSAYRTDFKNTWTDFQGSYLVFMGLGDTNRGGVSFQTNVSTPAKYITNLSNKGLLTAYPLNHEINHLWLISSEFNFFSSHLRYIERPQSGFGYDCYNGVMTNIYEENGTIKFDVDKADNPHDYYYNDIELNLMGVLPIDSVAFPIKYFKRNSFSSSDCNSTFDTLSDGSIEYLSKEEYIDFKAGVDLEDVSDGFELKFIFLTERPISKLEHAFLEYLVLHYEGIFEESASNLVDLDTEIYDLQTTTSLSVLNDHAISIYPNPTSGILTIDSEKQIEGKLIISNIEGKIMKTEQIQNSRNTIDISALPGGLYLIQFIDPKGQHWTERMVKY